MEMATLMKGLIPIETLARMPLPFVHRLRDLRIKQIEAKRRQQEIMANKMPKFNGDVNSNNYAPPNMSGFDESAIEELVDELT